MGLMRWTRFGAVAMTALITGSMAIAAQDAPEAPQPDAPSEKPAVRELDPNKAPEGKFKLVTVSDLKLTDAARKKDLGLVAIFPEEAGKYPVVIYSHGAGGSNANVPLAQYIASHGYVVLVPSHADSREAAAAAQLEATFQQYDANKDGKIAKEELPEMIQGMFDTLDGDGDGFLSKEELSALANRMGGGRGRGQGGGQTPRPPQDDKVPGEDDFDSLGDPRESLLEDPAEPQPPAQPRQRQPRTGRQRGPAPLDAKAGMDRAADIKLLLDSSAKLVELAPGLKDKMDLEKVAVAGHNHGAYTAELLAGATFDLPAEEDGEAKKAQSVADKRVKAIIALSPAGSGHGGLTKESFKGIAVPMLSVTGSNDTTGEGQDAKWKREAFDNAPERFKYHVVLEGAANQQLAGGQAFGRGRNRGGEQPPASPVFEWVKSTTIVFLDATLKGDALSGSWLESDALSKGTSEKAKLERR